VSIRHGTLREKEVGDHLAKLGRDSTLKLTLGLGTAPHPYVSVRGKLSLVVHGSPVWPKTKRFLSATSMPVKLHKLSHAMLHEPRCLL
jgi:hypothetical protein